MNEQSNEDHGDALREVGAKAGEVARALDEQHGDALREVGTNLGDVVRGIKEQRGWSQRRLAEVTGLSHSHIAKIERNVSGVADEKLQNFRLIEDLSEEEWQELADAQLTRKVETRRRLTGPRAIVPDDLAARLDRLESKLDLIISTLDL